MALAVVPACSSTPAGLADARRAWAVRRAEQDGTRGPEASSQADAARTDLASEAVPSDLAGVLALAERRNRGLRAAHERWRAALERVPQAASLPDPRLTLGWFADGIETRTGPMQGRLGLSQGFPWFGTLDVGARAALARAEAAAERYEDARLDLQQRVRGAWWEWTWLERAIAITAEHEELWRRWEEIAQVRYATGTGGDADVIRAQVELGKLDDRLATLRDLRRPLVARLNAALDRPADAPLSPPAQAWPQAAAFEESDLRAGLPRTSPALRALEGEAEAAALGIELAEKGRYPGFAVGVEYTAIGAARMPGTSGSGDDAVALTLGVDLPLRRGRIEAAVAEATARHSASRAALAEAVNAASAELELALYDLRDARRRVDLYGETLVPKGRQSVQSVVGAYEADAAGFLDLIDAERVLLEFQLAAARAAADRAQALARLARLTGVPLVPEPSP